MLPLKPLILRWLASTFPSAVLRWTCADQGDFLLEEEATPEQVDDFWEELQRIEDPVAALHQRVTALTGRAWLYQQDWDWTITEHLVEEACEQEEHSRDAR